jgi:hypothetical protein
MRSSEDMVLCFREPDAFILHLRARRYRKDGTGTSWDDFPSGRIDCVPDRYVSTLPKTSIFILNPSGLSTSGTMIRQNVCKVVACGCRRYYFCP